MKPFIGPGPLQDALMLAAQNDDAVATRWLLDHGADPMERWGVSNETPLRQALRKNSLSALKEIVKNLTFPCAEPEGSTPLMWVAMFGFDEAIDVLLPVCDPKARLPGVGSALMLAAARSEKACAKLLPWSDVNAVDDLGRSALHLAAKSGSTSIVRMLLEAGAQASIDLSGNSALTYALLDRHVDCAMELMDAAHLALPIAKGLSPLMVAARAGSIHLVEALLAVGADPLQKTTRGETALMFAAESTCNQCVALLAPVSDLLAVGRRGAARGRAQDFARRQGFGHRADFLQAAEQQMRSKLEAAALSRSTKKQPTAPARAPKPRL
jgi:ankyrin repeat protein